MIGPHVDRLFSDAPDWNTPWPTYPYPPPPASAKVNARIWLAHSAMVTSCEGDTSGFSGGPFPTNNSLKGQVIFSSYTVSYQWASNTNVDYGWATEPNRKGCPNLLTGHSNWNAGADPSHGHAVVCAGYNDNDQHLQLSLDGNQFPRRWVAFSTISQPCTYLVTHFAAREASDDEQRGFGGVSDRYESVEVPLTSAPRRTRSESLR